MPNKHRNPFSRLWSCVEGEQPSNREAGRDSDPRQLVAASKRVRDPVVGEHGEDGPAANASMNSITSSQRPVSGRSPRADGPSCAQDR